MEVMDNPMPRIGGYTLDVYCRYDGDYSHQDRYYPQQFHGHSEAECNKAAKDAGWVYHRDGTSTCPKCAIRFGLRPYRR